MRWTTVYLCIGLAADSGFSAPPNSQVRPVTIPALREWTDAPGSYTFSSASRIVITGSGSSETTQTANTLAKDLEFLSGFKIPVTSGATRPGDIILTLDPAGLFGGDEGYRFNVTDRLEIISGTAVGSFYGTRTLLQLLRQNYTIAAGNARDWPDYNERGLMVDVGRKFFSMAWLKNHIVDLSYMKLNLLHLHLSDDLGIRLASTKHPEIVSPQFYSKADIRELVNLAAEYHVQIIPEIDVPGHTGWLRNSHTDLILGSNVLGTYYMDITKPAAFNLVKDILEEYLPEFPSPYWHTGADEFILAANYGDYPQLDSYAKSRYGQGANGIDAYLGFLNSINDIVRSHGKRLRTWADAFEFNSINRNSPVPLDTSIVQEIWNAYQDPKVIMAKGFSIQNSSFHPTYYNLGSYQGEVDTLYEDWAPHKRMGGWERAGWGYPISVAPLASKLTGAKLSIWCDQATAETENQVAEGIRFRLRAIAQNCWGSPHLVTGYPAFATLVDRIGRAPGYGKDIAVSIAIHTRSECAKAALQNGPGVFGAAFLPSKATWFDLQGRTHEF